MSCMTDANPLLETWTTPFGVPPFGLIRPAHFPPGFEAAMAAHRAEVAAIGADPAPPDFANTVEALERAGAMNAAYHVLGGTLSPLDGVGPDDLNIRGLIERVMKGGVKEIIIAVNATVEGQTTAHYVTSQLTGLDVKITRLAHGVPVGGELDYLDEGTLTAALRSRTSI